MAKFEQTFLTFVFGALIITSLFAFVIQFQADNTDGEKIADNTLINDSFSRLIEDLGGFRDQSQSQRELFESERPTSGFGSLILFSIVSSGKVFTGMTIGVFNILIKLPMAFFGFDPIVSSVLSTVLLVSVILGLWALYKLGG